MTSVRSCDAALLAPAVLLLALASAADGFVVPTTTRPAASSAAVALASNHNVAFVRLSERRRRPASLLGMTSDDSPPDDDVSGDDEGQSLASDFFKAVQERNLDLEVDDLLGDDEDDEDEDDDEEEEEDDDEEEEVNFPQGAINAMTGFDAGDVGDGLLAGDGNVTLTNKQVYDELNERVLETAGGFLELVGGANNDDDDEDEDEDGNAKPKEYKTPTKVPDPELTAGEVVTTVLEALLNNNSPSPNRGVQVLFGYSSPGSAVMSAIDDGMTAEEYADFLEESEYKVLFQHEDIMIDKGDYSFDRKKAFYNARLRTGNGALDFVKVNFILSTKGNEEDDCWLIDSMLIRPEKMRRRRR